MALRPPTFYAGVSIAAAIVTVGLKVFAWKITGSDRPSLRRRRIGREPPRGSRGALGPLARGKAGRRDVFLRTDEGGIPLERVRGADDPRGGRRDRVAAVERLKNLQPIENVALGLGISVVASAINGGVAVVLLRAGKRLRSITLRADAHTCLTDVWTSAGVLVGVLLVKLTGWLVLDPLVALLVAANIVWTGVRLLQETGHGLLDRAIAEDEQAAIAGLLERFHARGVVIHGLRTRAAGPRRFVQMHVLVPGSWSVRQGHDLCEEIERGVTAALPGSTVTTHLEPLEDPASWDDRGLDRRE